MRTRVRGGTAAVEVLFGALLLVLVAVPLMENFQTSHRMTVHDQRRLLALREAGRIQARLAHLPLARLRAAATGDEAPMDRHARLAEAGRGLDLGLLGAAGPGTAGDGSVRALAYYSEKEEGLGRVAILVEWDDRPHPAPRSMVQVLLVEDPEQPRRIP